MRVSGCDIEGNAGPGLVAFGTRVLSVESNYFEANNKATGWPATGPPGWAGRPFTMAPETPLSGDPTGAHQRALTVRADVVFTGGPSFDEGNAWRGQPGNGSAYNFSRFPAWLYGIAYPVTAVRAARRLACHRAVALHRRASTLHQIS